MFNRWLAHPCLAKFAEYFLKNKYEDFKYHLNEGVVGKAGIVNKGPLFRTNALESLNGMMKNLLQCVPHHLEQEKHCHIESISSLQGNSFSTILRQFVKLRSPTV